MNTTVEIVKTMTKHGLTKFPSRPVVTRIIHRFFELVKEEVLKGHTVVMPKKFGEMKITKRIQKKIPPNSRAQLFKEQKKVAAINMKTLGYYFTIDSSSEFMERFGIKFEAAYSFRKALNLNLRSGFDNYNMIWIPRKSQ